MQRRRSLSFIVGLSLTASLFIASPVAAATQSQQLDWTIQTLPGSIGSQGFHISVLGGLYETDVTVGAQASITQPVRETLTYDDANIRQGRTLAVERTIAANGPGELTVTWFVDGGGGLAGTYESTSACTLSFTGPTTCSASTAGITVFGTVPVPFTPFVDINMTAQVTFTPSVTDVGVSILSGGTAVGGSSTQAIPGTQNVNVPCAAPAGETLAAQETNLVMDVHVDGEAGPAVVTGIWTPTLDPPFIEKTGLVSVPLGALASDEFDAFASDGSTQIAELGEILPNNVPPVADAGGPYAGNEGQPIQFDGSGTTALCGPATLRWDFSDGGVAFGPTPFHTFDDSGTFSGLLTATDTTGLTSMTTFSISVGNRDPVANAGPDTTAAWGRQVAFNGAATDAAGDLATLHYEWDFGDGSPSATGGPSVQHAYSVPGTYTATFTVTDKDGGTHSDTRDVIVRKRVVSASYLGETAATYDTGTTLRASLIDEFGEIVQGRSVTFSVDGSAVGSSSTGSIGIATLAWIPDLAAGTHATVASFAGDAMYEADDGAGSIAIARKATSLVYSGALSGGPNKTINLSATLTDATGTPLAGRTIDFVLGAQTISAATDATGFATVDLKITQKNGTYPLTATWSPVAADADRYDGSADSETFILGGGKGGKAGK